MKPLIEHFWHGMFRPESAAGEDSYSTWIVQVLAIVIAASWYLPVQLLGRYARLHTSASPETFRLTYSSDCLAALVLMTLLAAALTTVEWSALFPTRRDHLVLTPLPITRAQFFGAKLIALLLFVTLFLAAIALISGVALPAVASGRWEERSLLLRIAGFLVPALGTCYFTFLALLAVQGVLLAILPVRWFEPASFTVQMVLLIALLCCFPLYPYFPARLLVRTLPASLDWLPPAWFWALGERMLGASNETVTRLASRAGWGIGVAALLAAGGYLSSYARKGRFSLEAPPRGRFRLSLLGRTIRFSQARAVWEFVAWTLVRGRQQKLIFFGMLGAGIALVLESSFSLTFRAGDFRTSSAIQEAVISAPLTLSFFAMVGLRRAYRIAAELPANWLFQLFEEAEVRPRQLNAVFWAFLCCTALPALAVCAPLEFVFFGAGAVPALALEALLMVALAEYLLTGWREIPFTCAQNHARRHVVQSIVVHLAELVVYSGPTSFWIRLSIHSGWAFTKFTAVLVVFVIWLHRRRMREWGEQPFEFEEGDPETVQGLQLTAG